MSSIILVKMKLFCFLITFFLVSVSAAIEAYYNKQVAITNAAIELAYNMNDLFVGDNTLANGLEYVIEKMVNDEDYYKCFAKINLMIALPDKMDLICFIQGNEYLRIPIYANWITPRCNYYQYNMQEEIINTLNIPRTHLGRDIENSNLTDLAVQRRRYVKQALKNIFRRKLGSMYNEFIIQLEIRDSLSVEGLNLTTLTEERRLTGRPIENGIRHVLGTDVSEVAEDQSRSVYGVSLLRMCRLMGLYLSTLFPTTYIIKLRIDPINYTCSLDDGNLQRRLKNINGVWWQINSTTSRAVNTN